MGLVVQVCARCGDQGAVSVLETELSGLADVRFRHIKCDEPCEAPDQLWLQHAGAATYAFKNLDLHADRADILATVRTYLASPGGWIEDARPCGRLRFCLAARVPA